MDNLLRGSANTLNSHGAVVDSDSDGANEMDMDDSLPKSSKGIFRVSLNSYGSPIVYI